MTQRNGLPTTPVLQKERGIWVLRTGAELSNSSINRVVRQIREQRDRIAEGTK